MSLTREHGVLWQQKQGDTNMTVKQEQRLIAALGKAITAMDRATDLANKLGANTTVYMQLHAMQHIKVSRDYHMWHVGEVINGNIRD